MTYGKAAQGLGRQVKNVEADDLHANRSFLLFFATGTIQTLVVTLIAVFLLSGCEPSDKLNFQATDVTGADFGKALALNDYTGKPRTLSDFKGKVVVLFFGFTQCPDVCPTTLNKMSHVMKALGTDANQVQVLFVTVDPERDTPELLKQYVTAFDPSFLGLSGDSEATKAAAKEFKVFYQKVPSKNTGYSIDHTAATFILDQQGRLRLLVQHNAEAPALVADIRTLLKQAS